MGKHKKNVTQNNNKRTLNVRVNKNLLLMFSVVCKRKYNIKTISKGFSLILNTISENIKNEDFIFNVGRCDLSQYENDKKFSLNLNEVDMILLDNIASNLGVSQSDAFRKIILFEVLNYFFIIPNVNTVDYTIKKTEHGYTKFNFRVNRNLLELFMESYSINSGEDNITSALNDMIKQAINDSKRQSKEIVIGLASQNTSNINNDYKYNFTISNKRYSDFVVACSYLGLNPNECLRKKMMLYIHNNKDEN